MQSCLHNAHKARWSLPTIAVPLLPSPTGSHVPYHHLCCSRHGCCCCQSWLAAAARRRGAQLTASLSPSLPNSPQTYARAPRLEIRHPPHETLISAARAQSTPEAFSLSHVRRCASCILPLLWTGPSPSCHPLSPSSLTLFSHPRLPASSYTLFSHPLLPPCSPTLVSRPLLPDQGEGGHRRFRQLGLGDSQGKKISHLVFSHMSHAPFVLTCRTRISSRFVTRRPVPLFFPPLKMISFSRFLTRRPSSPPLPPQDYRSERAGPRWV